MRWLHELPVFFRCVAIGTLLAGAVGGVVGLVLGLYAYWPTAWFAVFELGVPSAVLGALIGAVAGVPAWWVTRRDLR